MVFIPGGSHKQTIRPALSPNRCRLGGGGTVVRLVPGTRTRAVSTIFRPRTAREEQSSATKTRSGGLQRVQPCSCSGSHALSTRSGRSLPKFDVTDQPAKSYFGMSFLPRLSPTDVEMSLTGRILLLVLRAAFARHRSCMVGSICLSSPCGDEAMYNARALSRVCLVGNYALISFNHLRKWRAGSVLLLLALV